MSKNSKKNKKQAKSELIAAKENIAVKENIAKQAKNSELIAVKENIAKSELIAVKENIAKQEYNLQQNFINQRTLNFIIESKDQSKKIEDIKVLMELDLNYKEKDSKIKNNSIAGNPVFIVDSKNEQNKRILNYMLWFTSLIGMPILMYSNPITAFFIGVVVILSILTVSFNTRITTTDKRMISTILSKLIENNNTKRKN